MNDSKGNTVLSRVLLNYGVLNFEIINKKEKKSIISSTSSISDLIFDEYDLKWYTMCTIYIFDFECDKKNYPLLKCSK
tara:strand:- start:727 stop:960 length:234 start_codon:yes stop_codon:yes gene_type:complete